MARFNDKKEPLDYGALVKDLKRNGPEKLYLLWGEEDYLLREFVKQIRSACLSEMSGDFDEKKLSGPIPDLGAVEDALDAMPFFGGRTYLEIQDADVNKWKDERLQKALCDIPDWCTAVLILPGGQTPDGRLSFVKQLKDQGKAVEFNSPDMSLIYNWIRRRVEAHGKNIGKEAMDRLTFLSGERMTGLIPEIEKICAHASGDTVTAADVEAVAHHLPEADTFAMAECLARGDMDGACVLLSELLAGDAAPMEILGVIGWQMRRLYAAKVAAGTRQGLTFAKEVLNTKSDYNVKKTTELADRFSRASLAGNVRLCAECVMWTRESGSVMEDVDALKELLIRFAMEARRA